MRRHSWARRAAISAFAAILGVGGLALPAQAATATTTATVTLRAGTSTSTAAIGSVPGGITINIECQAKGQAISGTYNTDWWAKLTYGGKTGYISRAYVTVPYGVNVPTCGTTGTSTGSATVVGGPLSLRTTASTSGAILATIPDGAALTLQCQTKGQAIVGTYSTDWWAKLTYAGKTGYASRAYIRVPVGVNVPTCADSAPPTSGTVSAWTPHTVGAPISRELVIARAKFWTNQRLPYNWNVSYPDPQGKYYRADCSGLVSMALHLSWSPNTESLTQYVYAISKSSLRPGDLIGNLGPGTGGAYGHVVVFNGWVPGTNQTQFYSLEQQGGVGAIAQVRPWGTSYWNKQGWRYNKISN